MEEALGLAAAALEATGDATGLSPSLILQQATALATTARERQVIALVAAHLAGDTDRAALLARDHLIDHPGEPIALRLTLEKS